MKGKPYAGISLLFPKALRGPPGITYLSDGRIAINNTLHHMHCGWLWDLDQVYLEQKITTGILLHHPS